MTWFLALLFIVVGAALQRVTGLGFALVSGPLLVLVLDPFNGIVLANMLSAAIAALVLLRTYRDTEWRTAGGLLIGAAIGLPLGAVVVHVLDSNVLLIVVGGLTGFAVLLALSNRPMRIFSTRPGTITAGALSGFSNVAAGVGGPALALYGAATAMPMRAFIPTVQAVGLATNLVSIAAKPQMSIPLPLLLGAFACMLLGLVVGSQLHRHVPAKRAQVLALALALLGATAAAARGVVAVIA